MARACAAAREAPGNAQQRAMRQARIAAARRWGIGLLTPVTRLFCMMRLLRACYGPVAGLLRACYGPVAGLLQDVLRDVLRACYGLDALGHAPFGPGQREFSQGASRPA